MTSEWQSRDYAPVCSTLEFSTLSAIPEFSQKGRPKSRGSRQRRRKEERRKLKIL